MATAADIWNEFPADVILQGKVSGWCTILEKVTTAFCMQLTFILY